MSGEQLKTTKLCAKCRQRKPRESFYTAPNAADRLMSSCKQCVAAFRTFYVSRNREKIRAWRREYEQRPEFKELRAYRMRRLRAQRRRALAIGTDQG